MGFQLLPLILHAKWEIGRVCWPLGFLTRQKVGARPGYLSRQGPSKEEQQGDRTTHTTGTAAMTTSSRNRCQGLLSRMNAIILTIDRDFWSGSRCAHQPQPDKGAGCPTVPTQLSPWRTRQGVVGPWFFLTLVGPKGLPTNSSPGTARTRRTLVPLRGKTPVRDEGIRVCRSRRDCSPGALSTHCALCYRYPGDRPKVAAGRGLASLLSV
ncbi:hypothetical protein B0T25DRAFT_20892 [Lasiosphaeria hispida]|uniref:Uncharacterized protein n=1 Tax=Lasiosphaeria hispida TaxID=260671 RepID=A0AAJ0HU09_9PEZI|nr:hypothetical protein B0T25DRAFT_20892 [Lasiosphaeria hispida]